MAKLERSYLFKVLYDRIAVWENYPIIFMLNRFKFPLKVWRFSTRRFCSRCCMEAGCSIKEAFLLWLGSQSINAQPLKKIVWRRKMWTIIINPSRSSVLPHAMVFSCWAKRSFPKANYGINIVLTSNEDPQTYKISSPGDLNFTYFVKRNGECCVLFSQFWTPFFLVTRWNFFAPGL